MPRILVVGGSDAGIAAALRAREFNRSVEITVVLADAFPNYSVCGLPFFVSGETPDATALAHRKAFDGIELLTNAVAERIDVANCGVSVRDGDGVRNMSYDHLIVATGARAVRPRLPGFDLPNTHCLHTMADGLAVVESLHSKAVRSAAIIGAGYIGLEMADALTRRGLKVTLLGRSSSVLPTVESAFGALLSGELENHGVSVRSGISVEAIVQAGDGLEVRWADQAIATDLVIVAAGVIPNTELATAAGMETGTGGALKTNRRMATNLPQVYAAGDCVETWHVLLNRPTYLPLGTTAHKQGRTAGENAAGGEREFAGVVGTQVVKVFELAAARTGLLPAEAARAGFTPRTAEITVWDHNVYYPHAQRLHIRVTGDASSGQLLGAQIVGPATAGVAKRIDLFAAVLQRGGSVDAINDMDLSYTPPLASPWDAVQQAAQHWLSGKENGG